MATDSINTVARPYAKAVFDIALDKEMLGEWSNMLALMSAVTEDETVKDFIDTPGKTTDEVVSFLTSICADNINESAQNLLQVLAKNRRLQVLTAVFQQFEILKAEQEKLLQVEVTSFSDLTDKQCNEMSQSLKDRLKRDIHLNVTIDKTILGGAVIRAGSLVIDGSVRNKLNALNLGLQEA